MISVAQSVAESVALASVNEAGVSGSIPGFDFIGANALAAYDIAPLKTGVTRCFRVRRSSDNTEQDCLNLAEALAFCGAGSGFITTLYDQNGSSNLTQATTTQQPRIVNSGVSDGAALLDGVNDFGTLGARLTSGSPSQLTVSAWIKTTDLDGTICGEFALADRGWAFYIANGTGRLTFTTGTGASTSVDYTGPNVNNNAWRHVAVTFNAGAIQLYVDGAAVTTTGSGAPSALRSTLSQFQVGAYSGNQLLYSGSLRDVRIYNVAKSASEIAAIYASVTP